MPERRIRQVKTLLRELPKSLHIPSVTQCSRWMEGCGEVIRPGVSTAVSCVLLLTGSWELSSYSGNSDIIGESLGKQQL